MLFKSDIKTPGLDPKELGIYLALNRSPQELREKNLLQFCPVRKYKQGKPSMTGCATSDQEDKRFKPWNNPEVKEPTEDDKRRMLAEAMVIAVTFVMKNHIYIFNKQIRRQSTGGPIGLALTGDVANVFMCWWDEELAKRLEVIGMQMPLYRRFVDDGNTLVRGGGIVAPDRGELERVTMETIQIEADKIHKSIKVTVDYPSRYRDGKMPILDLKCWLGSKEGRPMLMHEFYHKDVASRGVINARSAMSQKTMRTILTQEVLRVLMNCSKHLPWEEVCKHVQEYCARMQFSGHSTRMRGQVVRSALNAYDKIREKDARGEVPMYRPREWNREEREENRRKKKRYWFRGEDGKKESVVFVPATPGSELKRRFQRVIQEAGGMLAVVEKSGTKLKRILQRSDPFKDETCLKESKCLVCSGKGGGRCREEGVTYEIVCRECGRKYIGESSRNCFARGLEHKAGLQKKDKDSTLYSHCVEDHEGRITKFDMAVTGRYRRDHMKRQIAESVRIEEENNLLNRRDEWRHVNLPRIKLSLE